MNIYFFRSGIAAKLTAGIAVTLCIAVTNLMAADEVGFDDFEGLALGPYVYQNSFLSPGGDGTDYTLDLPAGWTRDISLLSAPSAEGPHWDGPVVHDVSSWSSHDYQYRSISGALGERHSRNSVLVMDGDEWADGGTDGGEDGFNGYIYKTFTTTGDSSQTAVSFNYEFRAYDQQTMLFEITTDDPTNPAAIWNTVFQVGPVDSELRRNQIRSGVGETISVGNGDFADPGNTFTLRVGCINADNDWWCAVDNIEVSTDTFSELTDFEGLAMVAYPAATPTVRDTPIGDGTDWTDVIPGWTSDLSMMQYVRAAPCWEGFTAHDAFSWHELGKQNRNKLFGVLMDPDPFAMFIGLDPDNTILVADGDAWSFHDIVVDNGIVPDEGSDQFNAYISRSYDIEGFDNRTLSVTFDWQHRPSGDQRPVVQVSFDGGATWTNIWEFDSDAIVEWDVFIAEGDPANVPNPDYDADFAAAISIYQTPDDPNAELYGLLPADSYQSGGFFSDNCPDLPYTELDESQLDFCRTPQTIAIDPTEVGLSTFNVAPEMTLRLGYLDAGDDWWFAVDNILVEADAQDFVNGDVTGDGFFTNADVGGIILALTDPAGFAAAFPGIDPDLVLDFNGDGILTNADVGGMIAVLTGG